MSFRTSLLLSVSAILALSSPLAFAKKAPKLQFEKEQVSIGSTISGELLYLELGNGETDLLIQQSSLFKRFKNFGSASLESNVSEVTIPESAIFYNKGTLAKHGGEVLFYLTADAIVSFEVDTGVSQTLITDKHLYSSLEVEKVRRSDFVTDINGDGLSDFVTSTFTHTNVYMQGKNGEFKKIQLEIAPRGRVYSDSVEFSLNQAHVLDINNDGKTDLAFQVYDRLLAFTQTGNGELETQAVEIPLNAGLLTPKELAAQRQKHQEEEKSGRKSVSFEALKDLNNDGVTDLITKSSKREGITSSVNEFQIRYGTVQQGRLTFSEQVDTKMRLEGEGELKFSDVNNDGKQDLYTLSIEIGVGALMSLMSGSMDMDLQIFPMKTDDKFDDEASFKEEVEVSVDMDSDDNAGPVIALEDFNGDGLKDLMLKSDDDELNIIYGREGKRLFAKRGAKYDTDLDMTGKVDIKDINQDGKADLVFRMAYKKGESQLMRWLSKPES